MYFFFERTLVHLYIEKILVVFYEITSCLLCKVVCYIKYSNGCTFPFQGTKKIIYTLFFDRKECGQRNCKYNSCVSSHHSYGSKEPQAVTLATAH